MDAEHVDSLVSGIAASIGEPARARMLYCLLDGHARTSTELGVVAEVGPSTASVHLARLKEFQLVKVHAQGKHRYYALADANVARALEALSVVAGSKAARFVPNTPSRLRAARTCYDHMAGQMAVSLHDRLRSAGWLRDAGAELELTDEGIEGMTRLGIDLESTRSLRRRFAFGCLDWSERKPHIGGALGAALLKLALARRWVRRETDGRALVLTEAGRKEMAALPATPKSRR
jgi:DNA-binding transcriptional ArsR family regulator